MTITRNVSPGKSCKVHLQQNPKGVNVMSLDKAIAHGKEHRKPYRGSKAIDRTCRNHGGCPWCEENRKHKFRDRHPQEEDESTGLQGDLTEPIERFA